MRGESLDQRADFRALVDRLDGMALWFVSDQGKFDYISNGFEDIWGISPAEVKADPSRLLETIHPDDRDRVRAEMERPESELSETTYTCRIVQPDGTVRWVQVQQTPYRDDDGNVTDIVGVCTDITAQKRREIELETLNRIIRHDIRNDLGVVLGWADLLEDHVDEAGREQLRRIQHAGDHIVELTEIARDYAETVTGDGDLDTHPVSLRPTLRNELDVVRESFSRAEFDVSGEVPDVDVMANEMLASVFKNLLRNAVQHNDRDQPVVTVSCETTSEAVVVNIADNGPGVPDEQKDSIFDNEVKGLDSTGTGIGLYLVQTLVEQYGGDVRVEDNEPRGAVFSVRLRRAT